MFLLIRKVIFAFLFNSSLFLILFIGLQNNSNKSKVNFLLGKTVSLPIGFIVGTSFISGSILGGLLNVQFSDEN
ncbi:hypothetical protein EU99_1854 [Prochlorococcus marinus str. MIT 9321]|uniref:DUF1049 domain-containing protein n=1 Tax=Prochlorococcus marinus str. MIT 9401 TaxID=167551 RepID=A0A0A2BD83_PROMR|nr:hypothetical protein [Prochlorococcus marinus]KGG02892.1 hypothetical protein EU99_1854 [Prochlorococcus marinus str. MIT 9321]KGG05515.1 hypothetical protein EV00_1149 [Prochlorococcus marinus str. MIT 9322]KGG10549.1 hypothetical protein EV01_0177 [Prochlorococcus marinus str. MIT 9401]